MNEGTEREFIGNGRYAVDQLLGSGGNGSVVLAYDTALSRWVAVKRIPAEHGVDFQEATILASFQHPNIVTIFDIFTENDEAFLVMEFVQGQTLEELAEPMTEETFRDFAKQCLEGLGAAHSKNIVHRDIKPGNIMFALQPSGGYLAKLLDFGQSRLMRKPSLQTIDHSGAVFGSIYMMSPEQLNREELDSRTDFYSLGCVFYQALTLKRPFTGDTVAQVLAAHLQHRFEPLALLRPDLPKPMLYWVEKMFAFNRKDRPSNARQALQLLNETASFTARVKIASSNTKGVKVLAGPVLKPISVVKLPSSPIRIAPPVPQVVSSAVPVVVTPVVEPIRVSAAMPLGVPALAAAPVVVKPVIEPIPVPVVATAPASVVVRPVIEPVPVSVAVSVSAPMVVTPVIEAIPVSQIEADEETVTAWSNEQQTVGDQEPDLADANSHEESSHGSAINADPFLQAAMDEARRSLDAGGIPIGSVLVLDGEIIGRGHNRRVQDGSVIHHAEMNCLENAGRLPAEIYRRCTLYSTLSPCPMCSGAIRLYGIPKVVIGENKTFQGPEADLRARGVELEIRNHPECISMMEQFIRSEPDLWNEDIGVPENSA